MHYVWPTHRQKDILYKHAHRPSYVCIHDKKITSRNIMGIQFFQLFGNIKFV